jgi:mannose-6-phosphate isomerase
MNDVAVLQNPVMHYAWGSPTAIPALMGRENPDGTPWAELWMGAHPKAPSSVEIEGVSVPLTTLIERDPGGVLGPSVAERFGGQLPFLLKILAAAQPLSIQAHPDAAAARRGFESENRAGILLDAPERSYRDDRAKPECICALTPFTAMVGFRPIPEILKPAGDLGLTAGPGPFARLVADPTPAGLKSFYTELMTQDKTARGRLIGAAVGRAEAETDRSPVARWIVRLHEAYPGDPGVLSPVFLNLVELSPGQALYLSPGELHAYLDGTGIEIMGGSDNVLRGGLTPKHIDVDGLLSVLRFDPYSASPITPTGDGPERIYPTPAAEFRLSVISLEAATSVDLDAGGVEILLCTEGTVTVEGTLGNRVRLGPGTAALVPGAVARYRLRGEGRVFRAAVPGDGPPAVA